MSAVSCVVARGGEDGVRNKGKGQCQHHRPALCCRRTSVDGKEKRPRVRRAVQVVQQRLHCGLQRVAVCSAAAVGAAIAQALHLQEERVALAGMRREQRGKQHMR